MKNILTVKELNEASSKGTIFVKFKYQYKPGRTGVEDTACSNVAELKSTLTRYNKTGYTDTTEHPIVGTVSLEYNGKTTKIEPDFLMLLLGIKKGK